MPATLSTPSKSRAEHYWRQLIQGRHPLQQLVGKRPPQHCSQLRHHLPLGEPVQPGPQRVL